MGVKVCRLAMAMLAALAVLICFAPKACEPSGVGARTTS